MLLKPEEVDEANHKYGPGGVQVPSVTDVLKATGFIHQRSGDPTVIDYYMARGAWAHKAIGLLEMGTLDWAALDPRLEPYLAAWKLFKKDTGLIIKNPVRDMEQARYSIIMNLAGRLDWVGEIPGVGLVLADNKTGPVQGWTRLQLALYDLLDDKEPYRVHRLGLELKANGKYQPHWYRDFDDYNVARQALSCYWWQVGQGLRTVGG